MYYDGDALRRPQLVEPGILQGPDRFCQENSITYFLGYGTVLGRVRQGGFIPWDCHIALRARPLRCARRAEGQESEKTCTNTTHATRGSLPRRVMKQTAPLSFGRREFPSSDDLIASLEIRYKATWSMLPPVSRRRIHASVELDFGDLSDVR